MCVNQGKCCEMGNHGTILMQFLRQIYIFEAGYPKINYNIWYLAMW